MRWEPLLEILTGELQLTLNQVHLTPGQTLVQQGDPSGSMYFVVDGQLDVRIRPRRATEDVAVGRIGAGELVGEMGWLLGNRRSASVIAVGACTLIEVPAACLQALKEREHPALPRVAALLDQRYRRGRRVMSAAPVTDALTDWQDRRRGAQQDIEVVLLTHPRSPNDLRLALPWLADVSDTALDELSSWLRPVFGEVLQAAPSSVGLLFLPRFAKDLMDPRRRAEARRIIAQDCLSLARNNGARVLCLGGLTASLMKYGRTLPQADTTQSDTTQSGRLQVTTGHAVTAISCVRTFTRGVTHAGLDIEAEQLTVVGMGSVGRSFLDLLLTRDRLPRRIVLSDLPSQTKRLRGIAETLQARLPAGTSIEVVPTNSQGALEPDHPAYDSRLLFSATSAPEVIDIDRVLPGTLLVDDSQPHCWSRTKAWARVKARGDVFPCEAGLIDCSTLAFRSFFPFDYIEDAAAGTTHAWCCLTEGLLLARNAHLGPTIGEPTLESMVAYEAAFEEAGLRVAPLRCGPHLLGEHE
jgi:CRP-like cAMP-binding protein/predicted amino acid dehydrogenase